VYLIESIFSNVDHIKKRHLKINLLLSQTKNTINSQKYIKKNQYF
jgi:hypothetical protein